MNLKLLNDNILVKVKKIEPVINGVIVPDTAQHKKAQGLVVAVGDGKYTKKGVKVPCEAKTGDFVAFGDWAGVPITVEGQDYFLMKDSDVLAVIN